MGYYNRLKPPKKIGLRGGWLLISSYDVALTMSICYFSRKMPIFFKLVIYCVFNAIIC